MFFFDKRKYFQGFSMVEVVTAILLSSIIMGTLIYVVGEANFYLNKQMYRDNVNKYADSVMNDIFSSAINANSVNIDNKDQIVLGYSTNDAEIDSMRVYQHRPHQGVLVDGKPLEYAFFHNKDQNKNYYMHLKEFRADYNFDGHGNAEVRNVLIDIFLGIELFYKRGTSVIKEEFPYKKTIFTRYAAVYNASKEFDNE